MRKTIFLLFLVAFFSEAAFAQAKPIAALRRMFAYDRRLPLDMRETGVENRDGARVHDISYASPKGGRVTAYLVVPFLSWVPNLLVAEWYLATRHRDPSSQHRRPAAPATP